MLLTPAQQARVERQFIPEPNSGCWLWFGALDNNGYGNVRVHYKQIKPHRLMYELHKGKIPNGLHIDHLCRTPACVNPDHMEPVTCAENRRRGLLGNLKTHCKNGHPWAGDNIKPFPSGGRSCRVCKRARWHEWIKRNPNYVRPSEAMRRARCLFIAEAV